MVGSMSSFSKSDADKTMNFLNEKGFVRMFSMQNGTGVTVANFEPGWRWSNDMKDLVHTDSCEMTHDGYCINGSMNVTMNDGTQLFIKTGDVYHIEPGHDAETTEGAVLLDLRRDGLPDIGTS